MAAILAGVEGNNLLFYLTRLFYGSASFYSGKRLVLGLVTSYEVRRFLLLKLSEQVFPFF